MAGDVVVRGDLAQRRLLAAHCSCDFGQRVRNRQPDGGWIGDGTSPPSTRSSSGRIDGSGTGIAASSAPVYGCDGWAKRSSGAPTSHIFPRYMTRTRSLTFFTTARSCAMNTSVSP